jgi:hypothetical protein
MSEVRFNRYLLVQSAITALDPFTDVVDWLRYLTAEDYVTNVLVHTHSLSAAEAKARCRKIMPHIKDALAFIEQTVAAPNEASFVPTYYAMLNLAKVIILVGPKHAELPAHRWHGATYEVNAKDSQSILTEEIILKRGGALALFYETLVGKSWPTDRRVRMSELYPYLSDVAHEYGVATGLKTKLVSLSFKAVNAPRKRIRVVITAHSNDKIVPRAIPSAKGLKILEADKNTFITKKSFKGVSWDIIFDSLFDRRFVFHPLDEKFTRMPIGCGGFRFTEDLPIILVFFHLSSVARYKPEFLYSIMESRMWPVITTARRHCLYKFLLLFWAHFHRKTFYITQR